MFGLFLEGLESVVAINIWVRKEYLRNDEIGCRNVLFVFRVGTSVRI